MNDKQNQTALGIVGAFVLPLVIGLLFGWSGFTILWIIGALLAVVIAFVLLWTQAPQQTIDPFPEKPRTGSLDEDDEPRSIRKPPEPTKEAVTAQLPSNKADYTFQFSATMSWLPEHGVEHDDRSAVAAKAIFTRASRVTAKFALTDREEVLNRLRAALGSATPDDDGVVIASASDIEISTDAEDEERLRRMTNIGKRSEEFDYHCNFERHVRSYLQDEALQTPGSTLASWLARHRFDFDEAERRLGTFARISAVAQDREPPAQQAGGTGARFVAAGTPTGPRVDRRHPAATLIGELLPAATDDERGMFADDLARLLDEHDAADAAGRLRSGYGFQNLSTDAPGQTPGDDDHSGSHDPPADSGSGDPSTEED